jgi:hypothetical protein
MIIIRGIISKDQLQQIQSATAHHERNDESQGLSKTWNESYFIWVEVEVNESVMECLQNSGFFAGTE